MRREHGRRGAGRAGHGEGERPPEPREPSLAPGPSAWRSRRAEEIRAEIEHHVERRARALMEAGHSPEAARAEARRRIGDPRRIVEDCMRTWERHRRRTLVVGWFEDAARDVVLALRGLRRRPALAASIVLTLALAIGAATSVFSVVNGVLLRPLPYPAPNDLYSVYTRYLPETGYDFPYFTISGPEVADYRAITSAMAGVAAYQVGTVNLTPDDGEPERLVMVAATADLLDVLGVRPVLGRGFVPEDGRADAECVTVLGDGIWREWFGRDTAAVGRDVRMNGRPCRVVGIMPSGFVFPDERARLWTAMPLDPTSGRQSHGLQAVARRAPGAALATAEAELDGLRVRWSAEYPDHYQGGHFVVLRPFREDVVGDARPALLLLLGAVAAVLLIVCVNLAGLMLAGAESRRKEFAVRAALGVGRGRLVRQLLSESLVLAAVGGALGLLASGGMLRGMLALYPGRLPRAGEVAQDGTVLLFAVAVALGTGVLFGVAPALSTSTVRSREVLREGGRRASAGRVAARARRVFVVAQTALALLLALGSAVLARSYAQLRQVELGFDPRNVLTFGVVVPPGSYPEAGEARRYLAALEERLHAIPGAVASGVVSDLPLVSSGGADDFLIEGRPEPAPGEPAWNARYQMATPGALAALRLHLAAGRWIEAEDRQGAPPVAVVNEAMARAYFPGEDVIGRRVRYYECDPSYGGADCLNVAPWITVVGVVGNVRSVAVEQDAPPAIYTALAQAPRSGYPGRRANLVVRFASGAAERAPAVRATALEVDPTLPPSDVRTLEGLVTEAVGRPRFTMTLMSSFAGLALLLGALGIYGLLAHAVQLRTREIGIRLTLGAERGGVLRMVVGQGVGLALAGIVLGLGAALALRGVLEGLLFGVGPLDPLSLGLATGILLAVSLAASFVPALRAVLVDPRTALRSE